MDPVRVIGRIDLADEIGRLLRSAGLDAEVVTAAPATVYSATPPAEGVDVVVATSIFDLQLWRYAKRKHPARPMLAVAERRREGSLRGAVARRFGPDAYVTWPATAAALAAGVARARTAVAARRSFGRPDAALLIAWAGVVVMMMVNGQPTPTWTFVKAVGALAAGAGLLLGVPFAWSPRWQAAGGAALVALGALGVGLVAARPFYG